MVENAKSIYEVPLKLFNEGAMEQIYSHFNIKKRNYLFASLIGLTPTFFIMNTIGSGLNSYISQADNFSIIELILTPEIYLPIIMFSILMILS